MVFIAFLLITGFFLGVEHRAHVFGWLPFLLPTLVTLAMFPILLFMYGRLAKLEERWPRGA